MRFPRVTGSNLLRRKVTLPDDLQAKVGILFVPFYQWHQALVDSWVPLARQLEESFTGVQFFEVPVLEKRGLVYQTFINEGMRAGIPNQTTREKTITLYLDKQAFRRALDIPHEETMWVLLLDRAGNVVWRTEGAYSQDNGDALSKAVRERLLAK